MKCWICGADATTGEHLVKESTLKELFGKASQNKPLYYTDKHKRNWRLQSTNSQILKLRVLCADCNSSRTQQSDRAFDTLWDYLGKNKKSLHTGNVIRFSRVFGYRARKKMLNLHLYFVKLFGCVVAEQEEKKGTSTYIDIAGMSRAILHKQPYPYIYVGMGKRKDEMPLNFAGPSNLDAIVDTVENKCVFAVWFLTLGDWEFQFIYALPGQRRQGMSLTWNPLQRRQLLLKEF